MFDIRFFGFNFAIQTLKMYIQQIYTNCLSEAAYYIESNGEAAIIDPLTAINKLITAGRLNNYL